MLHEAALISSSMAAVSPRAAGITLVVAGITLKSSCLRATQNRFSDEDWRPGPGGSFGLGVSALCWALMIVLFAVGLMNLVWVAAIGALVLVKNRVGA